MYRIITVEREYGCGAGEIARQLSSKLGWKLWDRELTAEIARVANVDSSAVSMCRERKNCGGYRSWEGLYKTPKTLWTRWTASGRFSSSIISAPIGRRDRSIT